MQLSFDFALEVEQRAECGKESHAPDGANKLRYFFRLPTGELCSFDHVFGDFTEVGSLTGILDLDDAELLPDQPAPLDGKGRSVQPSAVNEYVRVQMPPPALIRYLRRNATALDVLPKSRSA